MSRPSSQSLDTQEEFMVFFELFMAQFDQSTLNHLKKLCRIDTSVSEDQDILDSLPRVLGYIEQLSEIDTKGVKPCNYVLRGMLKNRLRKDEISNPLSREQFLANAPDQIGGMIRVPPVLKPQ